MTDIAKTDELFFTRAGLDRSRVESIVTDALGNADDGELFLEYEQSESFVFDDGQLKNASFADFEQKKYTWPGGLIYYHGILGLSLRFQFLYDVFFITFS